MKNIVYWVTLGVVLLTSSVWAKGEKDYYAQLSAQVASTGGGMVYASTSSTEDSSKYVSQGEASSSEIAKINTSSNGGTIKFYAFAKPDTGYELKGWSETDGGAIKSTANPYEYSITAVSSSQSKPSAKTLYASFSKIPVFDGTEYRVATYEEFKSRLGSVQEGDVIVVNGDLTIPAGESVSVPARVKVVINAGKTVALLGSLSIPDSARWVGDGMFSRPYKVIRQASKVHVPWPGGTDGKAGAEEGVNGVDGTAGKYLVTTVEDANGVTVSGNIGCAQRWFVKVVNEASGAECVTEPTLTKPVGVLCTTARDKALNWIDTAGACYSSLKDLLVQTEGKNGYYDHNKLAVILENDQTITIGSSSQSYALGGIVDCAGNKLKISAGKQFNSTKLLRLFNSPSATVSSYLMNTGIAFINCTGGGVSSFGAKGYKTNVSFYDSPGVGITYEKDHKPTSSEKNGLFFYGGGVYSVVFQTVQPLFNKVFWGQFETDPTPYLYDANVVYAEQINNSLWEVKKFAPPDDADPEVVVTRGTDTLSSSLSDAFENAQTGDVITLQKDVDLTKDISLMSAENVRLDISGWKLSGDHVLTNLGDLEIIDSNGNGEFSIALANRGTLLLSEASYSGRITLAGGCCNFLAGSFAEIVFDDNVADVAAIAHIHGGRYAQLTYSFQGRNENLVDLCQNGYVYGDSIAEIPRSRFDVNGSQFSISAFTGDDSSLYTRHAEPKKYRADYTRLEWVTLNRLMASSEMFAKWGVDCSVKLDRQVNKEELSVTVSVPVGSINVSKNVAVSEDISADVFYNALFEGMKNSGEATAPYIYSTLMPGGNLASGLNFALNPSSSLYGTVCEAELRLATGIRNSSGPKDWSYTTYVTTATCRFTFGAGSNKAMIRPETGAATFYSTLAAAVANAATDNKTILLAADDDETVTVSKPCTIDVNGFAFSGTIAAGSGYMLDASTPGIYVVTEDTRPAVSVGTGDSKVQVPVTFQETVYPADRTTKDARAAWLETPQPNGNKTWQNLVMGIGASDVIKTVLGDVSTEAVTVRTPIASFSPVADTGVAVRYRLLASANGTQWTQKGGDAERPSFPVTVSTIPGVTLLKIVAVFTAAGAGADAPAETVESANVMGVKAVKQGAVETPVSVTWKGFDGRNLTVDKLVSAGVADGDEIAVWNDGTYSTWKRQGGAWVAATGTDGAVTPAAADRSLVRGTAFWYKRTAPGTFLQIGEHAGAAITTVTSAGTAPAPVNNLLVSPWAESVDLTRIAGAEGDRIVLLTSDREEYYFGKDVNDGNKVKLGRDVIGVNKWGGSTRTFTPVGSLALPANAGCWYISLGGSPTVAWPAPTGTGSGN